MDVQKFPKLKRGDWYDVELCRSLGIDDKKRIAVATILNQSEAFERRVFTRYGNTRFDCATTYQLALAFADGVSIEGLNLMCTDSFNELQLREIRYALMDFNIKYVRTFAKPSIPARDMFAYRMLLQYLVTDGENANIPAFFRSYFTLYE